MKKNIKKIIKIVFSVLLLVMLFKFVKIEAVLGQLDNINYTFLFIPFVIFFVGIYISSLKLKKILFFYGLNKKTKDVFIIYLMSSFYNNFLPSSIGGDGYKFYILNKEFNNKKGVLSSIALDRGFGFLSLFLTNIILSFIFFKQIFLNSTLIYLEIFIYVISIIIIIFLFANFDLKKIIFLKNNKYFLKFANLITTIKSITKNKKLVLYATLNSLIFNFISALSLWSLLLSLGLNVNIVIVLFVSTMTRIFSVVPISLNNIGVSESLYVFLFSFFGVESSVVLLASIIGRVLLIISSSSGGIFHFKKVVLVD